MTAEFFRLSSKFFINPMIDQLLIRIFFNQWMVFCVTVVLFFLIAEIGYRCGIPTCQARAAACKARSLVC